MDPERSEGGERYEIPREIREAEGRNTLEITADERK